MLTVVLIILAAAGVWMLAAVSFAFLAGGVIHARDHRDAPYGGFSGPRPLVRLAARPTR
jgi:hypothetical protein